MIKATRVEIHWPSTHLRLIEFEHFISLSSWVRKKAKGLREANTYCSNVFTLLQAFECTISNVPRESKITPRGYSDFRKYKPWKHPYGLWIVTKRFLFLFCFQPHPSNCILSIVWNTHVRCLCQYATSYHQTQHGMVWSERAAIIQPTVMPISLANSWVAPENFKLGRAFRKSCGRSVLFAMSDFKQATLAKSSFST